MDRTLSRGLYSPVPPLYNVPGLLILSTHLALPFTLPTLLPLPGNHAFIGLGLNKREDAFDLKSCLADVARSAEAEVSGAGVDLGIDGVSSDMLSGLKAGQTFTIKVGGAGGAGAKAPAPAAAARPLGSGRLAPPGSVPAPAPAAPAPAAPAPAAPAASTSSWETF